MNQPQTTKHIAFRDHLEPDSTILIHFPPARVAVLTPSAGDLEVILVPPTATPEQLLTALGQTSSPTLNARMRGVELLLTPTRAVLQCDPALVDDLLPAIADFAFYNAALATQEREIADSWTTLDEDRPLAFDVSPTTLKRSPEIGRRMNAVFSTRAHLARIEPHLYQPAPSLRGQARKLGEELRERADIESRAEILSGQIEVFEHIYEMASQRLGEFRAARQAHIVELVILLLLLLEAALMFAEVILRLKR